MVLVHLKLFGFGVVEIKKGKFVTTECDGKLLFVSDENETLDIFPTENVLYTEKVTDG